MKPEKLTISRFAKLANVNIETIRYYQRLGLISMPKTGKTSYREYNSEHIQQLRFIKRAQIAGFTLKEIKVLLNLHPSHDRSQIQAIAKHRLDDLTTQIKELQNIAQVLSLLIYECEHNHHVEACPIVEAIAKA